MFEILFSSDSVSQLMDRAYYLVLLGAHDADTITGAAPGATESLWLQESLDLRVERLERLQKQADEQRVAIEKDVAAQEKQARRIGADIARLVAGAASAATVLPAARRTGSSRPTRSSRRRTSATGSR